MKTLFHPALFLATLAFTAAPIATRAQAPFTDPNPGETDLQTLKRILVDNPAGPFTDPNPGEGISATLKRILLKPAPAAATPPPVGTAAGTYAAGDDTRITGADRGETFAHLLAATGAGTEASPYTHTDGTGGIGAALAARSRGGCVTLAAGRFDVTSAPVVSTPSTHIRGVALGANIDPNGESEGTNGTKIHTTTHGFKVALASGSTARVQGLSFEGFYVWGSGKTNYNGNAGIYISDCNLDQPHFTDLNFGNLGIGIQVAPSPGGAHALDTPYITRVNCLHCSYGLFFSGLGSIYAHVTDCCLADLDASGVYLNNSGGYNVFTGLTVVRTAGLQDQAINLRSVGNQVVNCYISDTGHRQLAGGYNAAADAVVMQAAGNIVEGGTIELTTHGSGVHVTNNAAGCVVRGVRFSGNATDITIDSGCTDTVVDCPGCPLNVADSGVRTVINGQSKNTGDPDTAGSWSGHAKPAGLQIIDTTTGDAWLYNAAFTGGRKKL